jgi:hypothetical protein
MTLIPDLERDLVRAARVQAKRRRRRWGRVSTRGLIVALAALLVVAGGSIAAGNLLFGADEHETQPAGSFGADTVLPGSTKLLAVRTEDPDGGPPWGLRLYKTESGSTCVQVGRVNAGQLGIVGSDGAFDDDGRFHRIPIQTSNCVGPNDTGRGMGGGFEPRPASGELYGRHGTCSPAEDRAYEEQQLELQKTRLATRRAQGRSTSQTEEHIRRIKQTLSDIVETCGPGRLRTIIADVAGPDAVSVTLHAKDGDVTRPVDGDDDGSFLFVMRGLPAATMPELPPYVSVTYRNGVTCPDDGPAKCVINSLKQAP